MQIILEVISTLKTHAECVGQHVGLTFSFSLTQFPLIYQCTLTVIALVQVNDICNSVVFYILFSSFLDYFKIHTL